MTRIPSHSHSRMNNNLSAAVVCLSTICLLLLPTSYAFSPISIPFATRTSSSSTSSSSFSSSSSLVLHALPKIVNEFSRTVEPDRIVKAAGGRRFFAMDIEATPEECNQLAKRFELPAIATLQASLAMRSTDGSGEELLVEGTILSTLTRTCVRTSLDFETQVEVPIHTTVRAVAGLATTGMENTNGDDAADAEQVRQYMDKEQPQAKRKKNKKYQAQAQQQQIRNVRSVTSMDVMELQRLLTSDLLSEDQDIMEDGSILTIGGRLDVGELVAQLFWLSLDKYPRTPGSEFTQVSISG